LFGLVAAVTATSCSKRIQEVTRDALRPSTTLKGTIARDFSPLVFIERRENFFLFIKIQICQKDLKMGNFVVSSKNFITDIHLQYYNMRELFYQLFKSGKYFLNYRENVP
jgi:hypothetical protein